MKCFYLFMFVLCCSSTFAQPINIYERPVQHEPSHSFDVLHYRIELDFEGKQRAFQGETTITLRSLADQLESLVLHAETYQVRSVLWENKKLAFMHEDGKLKINLAESVSYGDTISVRVVYETDNFQVDATEFGMAANYPLGIGFFESSEEHPFLFNAYSFPTGARHWFPCYDHPHDRATHETIVTTQADHKVLSNGLLQSVSNSGNGKVTYHWSQNQPHPTYLYNFVSGPYIVVEDIHKDIPVNYWVYPQDEEKALRSFHRTPEVLAFFEGYYGVDYPWDKYDQIIVPGIGGGAEATTATLIGASTLHDERAEQDFPSHWLVAHEAAHHWWGDYVSYRDWTETWLSESFATFSEYLYSNHLYGPEEGVLNLYNKRQAYLNEVRDRYMRPIVCHRWEYPNQNFDRHTYQKGALVLNMLRDFLGEVSFRRVLKHFLMKHAYQPVGTADFIKSVWEVTGEHLDWFFDQWLFATGHPVLDINYEWIDGQVILHVNQVQESVDQVPIYTMPVDVSITTEQVVETKTIWLKEKENTYRFELNQKPQLVDFDPHNILLKEWTFKKSKEELLHQAQHAPIISRLWAISQLEEYVDDEQVRIALQAWVKNESFWAIRREALEVFGRNHTKAFLSIYMLALQDEHSQVRAAGIKHLGKMKEPEFRDLFLDSYNNDDSYVVQAAAIRALGAIGSVSDLEFFKQVSKKKSPRDLFQRAGEWALNEIEKKEH